MPSSCCHNRVAPLRPHGACQNRGHVGSLRKQGPAPVPAKPPRPQWPLSSLSASDLSCLRSQTFLVRPLTWRWQGQGGSPRTSSSPVWRCSAGARCPWQPGPAAWRLLPSRQMCRCACRLSCSGFALQDGGGCGRKGAPFGRLTRRAPVLCG